MDSGTWRGGKGEEEREEEGEGEGSRHTEGHQANKQTNTHTHTHTERDTHLRRCKVQDSLCLQTSLSVRESIKGVFAMVTASTTVTDTSKGEGVHCMREEEGGRRGRGGRRPVRKG